MYILADFFVGNINNSELTYLEGNKFFYTNDRKNFKSIEIHADDLYEGTLKEFYARVPLHPLAILNSKDDSLKEFLNGDEGSLYIKVEISKNNKILRKGIVPIKDVDFTKSVDSLAAAKAVRLEDGLYNIFNICFPDMEYKDIIKAYSFRNETICSYKII